MIGTSYDDLNQIISAYNGANPRSGPNGGSGDNPNLLFPQQPNQQNGGQPLPINFQPNSSGAGPNTTLESFSVPVQGGILPKSTPTTPAPLSTIFIWNSSGPSDWPTDPELEHRLGAGFADRSSHHSVRYREL